MSPALKRLELPTFEFAGLAALAVGSRFYVLVLDYTLSRSTTYNLVRTLHNIPEVNGPRTKPTSDGSPRHLLREPDVYPRPTRYSLFENVLNYQPSHSLDLWDMSSIICVRQSVAHATHSGTSGWIIGHSDQLRGARLHISITSRRALLDPTRPLADASQPGLLQRGRGPSTCAPIRIAFQYKLPRECAAVCSPPASRNCARATNGSSTATLRPELARTASSAQSPRAALRLAPTNLGAQSRRRMANAAAECSNPLEPLAVRLHAHGLLARLRPLASSFALQTSQRARQQRRQRSQGTAHRSNICHAPVAAWSLRGPRTRCVRRRGYTRATSRRRAAHAAVTRAA